MHEQRIPRQSGDRELARRIGDRATDCMSVDLYQHLRDALACIINDPAA
jgi:hypothetical protein